MRDGRAQFGPGPRRQQQGQVVESAFNAARIVTDKRLDESMHFLGHIGGRGLGASGRMAGPGHGRIGLDRVLRFMHCVLQPVQGAAGIASRDQQALGRLGRLRQGAQAQLRSGALELVRQRRTRVRGG
ncbi:hypothetical protein D3C78_1356240 [compost metagenome]